MPQIPRPPSADYYKNHRNPGGVSRFPPGGRNPRAPGALVPYNPPATPIYPRPVGGTPPTKPPIPRLPGGVGRGIGGAFKVPVGAGSAAGRGAALVGRRIPYIALGFLAFDAFLLACAAGILPGNLCPRPDSPAPGGSFEPFTGGQCPTFYELFIEVFFDNGNGPRSNGGSLQQLRGPIYGLVYKKTGTAQSGAGWQVFVKHSGASGALQESYHAGAGGGASVWNSYAVIRSVRRLDGLPDDCGNPPPTNQPREMPQNINNISNVVNNININVFIPKGNPPNPQLKRSPILQSPPNPLPDIIIRGGNGNPSDGDYPDNYELEYTFNPQPNLNLQDPDDYFRNFPPNPSPNLNIPDYQERRNPQPQPAPLLIQVPTIPPPLSPDLPPGSTAPDIYQYRQNREILDKLYRANAEILEIQNTLSRQNLVLENLQRLLDFEVEGSQLITRCDGIDLFYSYKGKALAVINKQLDHVKEIEQIVIDEVCEVETASVVAAPDWWQVRLRGDVPQIALIFRVSANRTYHKLTIPHPKNTNELSVPPIPTYKKGNWQGELVLVDNSKFLCNCATKSEALRLTAIATTLIDPVFLGDPIRAYYAERKGHEVKQGDMHATSAMFFPFGQQQTRPEWRVSFTKDGR